MTVIQGIKELIGKEDINWGVSGSTFSRKTHLGGSTNIHYIDDAVIPASSLGGNVDDHLHSQNTDSLTTSLTFGINSTGNSLVLSSTGLTAARTFTFPDTSNQAIIGATDLVSTAAGLGASLVGVRDTGLYFAGTNVETVLQEVGADVSTLEASTHNRGMKNGFKLGYSSTSAITISGGMWALTGTTNRHVYTNSQITFTCGPLGSNGASSALGANEVTYIYIDDSAVTLAGTNLLTAVQFLNSTTVPAFSHSKAGWYNGLDRCIGAVLTNASSNILDFDIFGGEFYRYATPVHEFGSAAANTSYTGGSLDISSSVPRFSTRSRLRLVSATDNTIFYFDTESSATTPEAHAISGAHGTSTFDVPINSAQLVYWYASAGNVVDIAVTGYYLDEI